MSKSKHRRCLVATRRPRPHHIPPRALRRLTVLAACMLVCAASHAQLLTPHHATAAGGYNFWVYTPKDYDTADDAKKPLLLFLHGASLRGSNMSLALRYGPVDALRRGRHIDAVIVNPQCPRRSRWEPNKVMQVVRWVQQHYAVDTNRLYVIGMSLGGYGTLDFCGAYPDRVAAAMALCGGSHQKSYCGLNELPLWILHGTADRVVGLASSQKVVNAMKACGPTDRLLFTKLPGQGHGALARIFYIPETYEWLMRHSLTDSARAVCRDYSIEVPDIKRAYSGLSRVSIPIRGEASQAASGKNSEGRAAATGGASDSSKSAPHHKASHRQATYYTIRKGDTLGAIARRHHTSVAKICALNKGLGPKTVLRIGRRIRVR